MQDLKIVYVVIFYVKFYLQVWTSNKLLMHEKDVSHVSLLEIKNVRIRLQLKQFRTRIKVLPNNNN